ncbi:MAG: hypothetical protein U0703_24385 [Anaerolineae bacterium]
MNGYLAPALDIDGMAGRIVSLLGDLKKAHEMGAARARAFERRVISANCCWSRSGKAAELVRLNFACFNSPPMPTTRSAGFNDPVDQPARCLLRPHRRDHHARRAAGGSRQT